MKPKRKMIPALTLAQNYRLVMTDMGLRFEDLAKKAKVSRAQTYNIAERSSPKFVTQQTIRIGKVLGFTERQIREKVNHDRMERGQTYSKKERLYRAIRELIDIFDS